MGEEEAGRQEKCGIVGYQAFLLVCGCNLVARRPTRIQKFLIYALLFDQRCAHRATEYLSIKCWTNQNAAAAQSDNDLLGSDAVMRLRDGHRVHWTVREDVRLRRASGNWRG